MRSYFAILFFHGISISIVASSLIFLMWVNERYSTASFEFRAAKIAIIWLDCLISMGSSYFLVNTLSQDIQQHPLVATSLLAIAISIITGRTYAKRRYLPIICTGCVAPLICFGIWNNAVDNSSRAPTFLDLAEPFILLLLSAVYIIIACAVIYEAKDKDKEEQKKACKHKAPATAVTPYPF